MQCFHFVAFSDLILFIPAQSGSHATSYIIKDILAFEEEVIIIMFIHSCGGGGSGEGER